MGGKSHLLFEDFHVPASVYSHCQRENNVKELALFISLIYIRFWHEAPCTGKSSFNDAQHLQALENYPNRTIVKAATSTFCSHLCFFSEILVGLSFFDDIIDADVKRWQTSNFRHQRSVWSVFIIHLSWKCKTGKGKAGKRGTKTTRVEYMRTENAGT